MQPACERREETIAIRPLKLMKSLFPSVETCLARALPWQPLHTNSAQHGTAAFTQGIIFFFPNVNASLKATQAHAHTRAHTHTHYTMSTHTLHYEYKKSANTHPHTVAPAPPNNRLNAHTHARACMHTNARSSARTFIQGGLRADLNHSSKSLQKTTVRSAKTTLRATSWVHSDIHS